MQDSHTAFYKGGPSQTPVDLSSCAYLHNYFAEANDTLFAPQFAEITSASPVFTADDVDELSGFLATRLNAGNGADVLQRIEQSEYRPSKKLMDHVGTRESPSTYRSMSNWSSTRRFWPGRGRAFTTGDPR